MTEKTDHRAATAAFDGMKSRTTVIATRAHGGRRSISKYEDRASSTTSVWKCIQKKTPAIRVGSRGCKVLRAGCARGGVA
jgi:hypothetical protein